MFPALPLLTIAGGVGLDNILPPAHACIYPLSLIDNKDEYDVEDVSENEKNSRTTKRGLSQRWFDIFFRFVPYKSYTCLLN